MAASRSTQLLWWRWRRNPLKRRSAVIEAWIVLAGWVSALVVGLWAALGAAAAVERAADRERAESRAVSAVLTEDAKDALPARAVSDRQVRAGVRWTAPDGSLRTDKASVPPRTSTGSHVTVWTDKRGAVTSEPLTEGEARLQAALGGTVAAVGASGAMLGVAWVTRFYLDRCRMRRWAAEWEHVDAARWWRAAG
ncbi:Rv1733c family protein [Streptomyces sp. NPDC002817]|uniref:Rv1733c family protein n=1 Tax=Streptomyces sp. NPDC088357 TaxID=3154655 RepID=UPI003426378A